MQKHVSSVRSIYLSTADLLIPIDGIQLIAWKDKVASTGVDLSKILGWANQNIGGQKEVKVRPSHSKIPGGPKLARAALSRRAIDGP